jgi:hypothetical protein
MLTNLKRSALYLLLVAIVATTHVNCSKKQTASTSVTSSNDTEAIAVEDNAPAAELQNYSGRYNIDSDQISWAEVTVENNRLFGQSDGSPKAELIKEEGDTYKVQGMDATVTFTRDSQQQVTGMLIKTQGYEIKGEKVK